MSKPNSAGACANSPVQDAIARASLLIQSNKNGLDLSQQNLTGLKTHVQREEALVRAVKAHLYTLHLRNSLDEVSKDLKDRYRQLATCEGDPDALAAISALYIQISALLKRAHALQNEIASSQKQHQRYWKTFNKAGLALSHKSKPADAHNR